MIKIKSRKTPFDFQRYLANKLKSPTFRKHYNEHGKQLETARRLSTFHFRLSTSRRGSLLLELLIAIAVLAIVLSVGTNAVYVSLQSGKTSAESDVAVGLANEALEAARSTAEEKWQNIYDLTKGSQYHPVASSTANKWTLVTASEAIALNTASYTRYVTINNVSRDLSTRAIETSYNSLHDDPSTQKVAVTVSWQGNGSPVTVSDYFLRWRNKVCPQSSWAGGVSSGVKSCPGTGDTTFSTSTNLGTPGATLYIQ